MSYYTVELKVKLLHAAKDGNIDMVRVLVEEYAVDVNIKAHGWTCLGLSLKHGPPYKMFEYFLSKGARLGNTEVFFCLRYGLPDMLRRVLGSVEMDPEFTSDAYRRLILGDNQMGCVSNKLEQRVECIKILQAHGANILWQPARKVFWMTRLRFETGLNKIDRFPGKGVVSRFKKFLTLLLYEELCHGRWPWPKGHMPTRGIARHAWKEAALQLMRKTLVVTKSVKCAECLPLPEDMIREVQLFLLPHKFAATVLYRALPCADTQCLKTIVYEKNWEKKWRYDR